MASFIAKVIDKLKNDLIKMKQGLGYYISDQGIDDRKTRFKSYSNSLWDDIRRIEEQYESYESGEKLRSDEFDFGTDYETSKDLNYVDFPHIAPKVDQIIKIALQNNRFKDFNLTAWEEFKVTADILKRIEKEGPTDEIRKELKAQIDKLSAVIMKLTQDKSRIVKILTSIHDKK